MQIYYSLKGKNGTIKNLVGSDELTNGYLLFYRTALSSMSYTFDSLVKGEFMFANSGVQGGWEFGPSNNHEALKNLVNGNSMFQNSTVTKVTQDMNYLETAQNMFLNCVQLTEFDYQIMNEDTMELEWQKNGLSALNKAQNMFKGTAIQSFYRDLPLLKDGSHMFDGITTLMNVDDYKEGEVVFGKGFNGYDNLENGQKMFHGTAIQSFYRDLPSLTNGTEMFSESGLISFSNGDINQLTNGNKMFKGCTNLTTFYSSLAVLNTQTEMFKDCVNLETFYCKFPSLVNADTMFYGCISLATFYSDLSACTSADKTFKDCGALELFVCDLDKLKNADSTFEKCGELKHFYSNLASLTSIKEVFEDSTKLEHFSANMDSLDNMDKAFTNFADLSHFESNLPNVTSANYAFQACTSLTEFNVDDLEKLEFGEYMFDGCKSLNDFDTAFPELQIANYMFRSCEVITKTPSEISKLTEANSMFESCTNLTTWDAESKTDKLRESNKMFKDTKLQQWNKDLPALNIAQSMFENCTDFNDFHGNLDSLLDSTRMFKDCTSLQMFYGEMSSVTTVTEMFNNCTSLQSFYSKLSSLINGEKMFYECTALELFQGELPTLQEGNNMFYGCKSLTTFKSNLPSLVDGTSMFYGCTAFDGPAQYQKTDFNKLEIGNCMFTNCQTLSSFNYPTAILQDANNMFENCTSLTTIGDEVDDNSTFEGVVNGKEMFKGCTALTYFNSDLSKLEEAEGMFEGCTSLKQFYCDLSSLADGSQIFQDCKNLIVFYGKLSSLQTGEGMFKDCNSLLSFGVGEKSIHNLTNGKQMFYGCGNLDIFNVDIDNVTENNEMFKNSGLTTFSGGLKSITKPNDMFAGCKLQYFYSYGKDIGINSDAERFLKDSKNTLKKFEGNLPNLSSCERMFYDYSALEVFAGVLGNTPGVNCNEMFCLCTSLDNIESSDFSNVENGNYMFDKCQSLKSFSQDLHFDSLKNVYYMFNQSGLETTLGEEKFILDMGKQFPKVGNAHRMFIDCKSLHSIDFDVYNCPTGTEMFYNCTALTTCGSARFAHKGDYTNMFAGTKFDEDSVKTIFNAAHAAPVNKLHIGMGGKMTDKLKSDLHLVKIYEDYKEEYWCKGTSEVGMYYCSHGIYDTWHCPDSRQIEEGMWICSVHGIVGEPGDIMSHTCTAGGTVRKVEASKDESVIIVCDK